MPTIQTINNLSSGSTVRSALNSNFTNVTSSKFNATAAPTVNDDASNTSGNGVFQAGSVWIDVTGDNEYVCVDATATAAVWKTTTGVANISFTTATDPAISAATTQAIVNAYDGVIITTTTTGNAQTIASPTVTTAGKTFKIVNNDTSTNSITVNSVIVAAGKSAIFIWDGTAWLTEGCFYALDTSGQVTVTLPASSNFLVDGRTSPRTITEGAIRSNHTAGIAGTRAYNIDIIPAGFNDTSGVVIRTDTAGNTNNIRTKTFNSSIAVSGATNVRHIHYEASVTGVQDASVSVVGLNARQGVAPLMQSAGTVASADTAFTYTGSYTDVTTAFGSAGTDVQIFAALNDYVYIGHASKFSAIEVVLAVVASGAGVRPTFEYSKGGAVWGTLAVSDDTNGFRSSGNIFYSEPTDWATDTVNAVGSKYWVRLRRIQVGLATPPTEDTIKIIPETLYGWDKNGDVTANSVDIATGQSYEINSVGVLSGTALGSGVVSSSLTSVGTITTGVWTGTDIAVADGGTGASDASTARTNLGLAIGTNVQAYDASLTSLATLATAADKVMYTTALDTYAETALTAAGRAIIDDADATAQRVTLGLVIGTNVQAYDAGLTSLATLATVADKVPYTTAADTYAEATFTAAGRALVDDADATAQRVTLGLVIGTDIQAYNAGLADIAGLAKTDSNIIVGNGTNWVAESGATARTSLGLAIGTDVQAYDANTAKLDVAQEYTKTQNFNATSLTSSGASIAWDLSSNQVAIHTMTENTTLAAPTNQVQGATYILIINQHASAPKTLAFNSAFKFPAGTDPTITATNSAIDVLTFVSDGTSMLGVAQLNFS